MTHDVVISEPALEDLYDLYRWVSEIADRETADAYHARIAARLAKLSDFPNRGTPQDHLIPGARSISFERRIIIFYRIDGPIVDVLRIISAARESRALLS